MPYTVSSDFEINSFDFNEYSIRDLFDRSRSSGDQLQNWPVVYLINNKKQIYIGETGNFVSRMTQHLRSDEKKPLDIVRVVLHDDLNSSACLDLESSLIRWFSGDGRYQVLNKNDGVRQNNYPHRDAYQGLFRDVFNALRRQGLFSNSIEDIENSDLFKLSPFKTLNPNQEDVVYHLLTQLAIDRGQGSTTNPCVIQGEPGTGKTIVAVYLMKLLSDLSLPHYLDDDRVQERIFTPIISDHLRGLRRIGIVVPQQSLRKSIAKVFRQTPGLDMCHVLTAFDVGKSTERFDLLVVDEAHRLNQRANQASGVLNRDFMDINIKLFGQDDVQLTQLDWIKKQSDHQILMLDAQQTVRPADLDAFTVNQLLSDAQKTNRHYALRTQMRVRAGEDYVRWIRALLTGKDPGVIRLGEYELSIVDQLTALQEWVFERERLHKLSRMVAGYAWPWRSDPKKKEISALPLSERPFDIELDGLSLRWNSTDRDWIHSPNALNEVGSIHTVQGYDLNYAGVIIGADISMDPVSGQIVFNEDHYQDKKGVENNPKRGIYYSSEDILEFVKNIYAVLLTRGVRGTCIYVVDPILREHIRACIHKLRH